MKIAAAVAVLLAAGTAHAHFKLIAPDSSTVQAANGDPQKTAPCGGAGTASNVVTTVQTGSTLTVTIDETIYHPGHYRVALAQTAAQLPPDPTITGPNCAMAAIQNPPVLPILADGQLPHTMSFATPVQSFDVQIPAGMTCTNCVLQVIQFMRGSGSCFYYHCATVNITDSPAPPVDAGPGGGGGNNPDAGVGGGGGEGSGEVDGGCAAAGGGLSSGALLLGALAFARRRRR